MKNSNEKDFSIPLYDASERPGSGAGLKAIVNQGGVRFILTIHDYPRFEQYELDDFANTFLGLVVSEPEAFTKAQREHLSYIPFTKNLKYINSHHDHFDWKKVTDIINTPGDRIILEFKNSDSCEYGLILNSNWGKELYITISEGTGLYSSRHFSADAGWFNHFASEVSNCIEENFLDV